MDYKIDGELGKMIGTAEETRSKEIFGQLEVIACKIVLKGLDPETNEDRICFFNGYFYSPEKNLIITSGHLVGFNGLINPKYYYWHIPRGSAVVRTVYEMEVVKSVTDATLLKPIYEEDREGFSIDREYYGSLIAVSTGITPGTRVYIVAYLPTDKTTQIYSHGIVNCVSHGGSCFTTDASCDHGWSGAPVFTALGELAGMVEQGVGHAIVRTECIGSDKVDSFLTMVEPRLPGLYE